MNSFYTFGYIHLRNIKITAENKNITSKIYSYFSKITNSNNLDFKNLDFCGFASISRHIKPIFEI